MASGGTVGWQEPEGHYIADCDQDWIGFEIPEPRWKVTDLGVHPCVGQVASDSSIPAMGTVFSCDVLVGALPEGGFLSRASNFTQVDGTHA